MQQVWEEQVESSFPRKQGLLQNQVKDAGQGFRQRRQYKAGDEPVGRI
jgi:hypothetical protein